MLKPYDGYKETNIPWLEEVPSHWSENRAKNLYKKENREPLQDDEVVTCFRDGQVTLRKNRRTTGFTESIKEHGYQHINKGDLVIHVMDAFAGAVGVSDSSGKGTPVYSVCTSRVDINNYFYAYIIREMAKTGFIQSLYRGIRERSSDFRFEVFAMQLLPVPPREEQDQIVKYLDWQTSKINTLIKAKKKQIELLKEQKQAVINKAVMKVNGDEIKLKFITQAFGRIGFRGYTSADLVDENDGAITISPSNILGDSMSFDKCSYLNWNKYYESPEIMIQNNDILIVKTGSSYGKIGLVENLSKRATINPQLLVLKNIKCNVKYLWILLKHSSVQNQIRKEVIGSTIPTISENKILNLKIPYPPLEEQKTIVTYLKEKTALIDKAITVIEKEIELVSEYKTSLISSVVTGKVDVRDVIVPVFEVVANEVSEDDEGLEADVDDSN